MTIRPFLPGLTATFSMFASTATFADGLTKVVANTGDFEMVFDETTGENVGVYKLAIIIPTGETRYCFSYSLDQHSRRGTATSAVLSVNGINYVIDVEKLIIPRNRMGWTLKVTTSSSGEKTVSAIGRVRKDGQGPTLRDNTIEITGSTTEHSLRVEAGDKTGAYDIIWTITADGETVQGETKKKIIVIGENSWEPPMEAGGARITVSDNGWAHSFDSVEHVVCSITGGEGIVDNDTYWVPDSDFEETGNGKDVLRRQNIDLSKAYWDSLKTSTGRGVFRPRHGKSVNWFALEHGTCPISVRIYDPETEYAEEGNTDDPDDLTLYSECTGYRMGLSYSVSGVMERNGTCWEGKKISVKGSKYSDETERFEAIMGWNKINIKDTQALSHHVKLSVVVQPSYVVPRGKIIADLEISAKVQVKGWVQDNDEWDCIPWENNGTWALSSPGGKWGLPQLSYNWGSSPDDEGMVVAWWSYDTDSINKIGEPRRCNEVGINLSGIPGDGAISSGQLGDMVALLGETQIVLPETFVQKERTGMSLGINDKSFGEIQVNALAEVYVNSWFVYVGAQGFLTLNEPMLSITKVLYSKD
jgi:hypothetical protein